MQKLSDVQVGDRVCGYVFRCASCGVRFIGRQGTTFCGSSCKQKAHREERSAFAGRDQKMLEARRAGMSFNEIGKKYGLHPTSARIACYKAERTSPPMSIRAFNVLVNSGIIPTDRNPGLGWEQQREKDVAAMSDPEAIAKMAAILSRRYLKNAQNCGEKSIAEISAWLLKHGHLMRE
jgi:hypothetical protein